MQYPNIICTIPARLGSKRLIRKNILDLAGKPMLAYSIEVALASQLFDHVYVCTESEKIAKVAESYGATVPTLVPAELCDDLIASHVPCQYITDFLNQSSPRYDALACLQPSSPLRTQDDLVRSLQHFVDHHLNFLVSVTPIDPHYFHWAVIPQNADSEHWHMYFGDEYMRERLLLPPVFRPNGSIKIAKLAPLKERGNFFGQQMGVIETEEAHSIHVATQYDFDICEMLIRQRG